MPNILNFQVKRALLQKVLQAKARHRPVRLRKAAKPQSPKIIQMAYMKELQAISKKLKEISRTQVYPEIERVLESASIHRPHTDDYVDDVEKIMRNLRLKYAESYSDAEIRGIAQRIAKRTNDFNENQFKTSIGKVLEIDIFSHEPWLQQEMNAFVADNVSLIKTIPEEYFGRIQKIVMQGARSGQLASDIASDLADKTDPWAESRLDFIARDQVAKFNGNLTELRQTNIGIEKYIWSTSHDERVRGDPGGKYPNAIPSHFANDGKIFAWDDPPETGHPGEDYQCRCVAIPYFEELLSDAIDEAA